MEPDLVAIYEAADLAGAPSPDVAAALEQLERQQDVTRSIIREAIGEATDVRAWWESVHRAGRDQDRMYTRPWGRERMTKVKELLEPLIEPRGRYLDLGCGLGRYSAWMAGKTPGGMVVGVDISQESLDRAEQRWNLFYKQASWEQLPYLGAFDVVLATEVLEHAEDPETLCKRFPAATWVLTVPCERPAPAATRWTPDGHGHLQSFDEERVRGLFKEVRHFSTDGRYFYLVGK